MNILLWVLQLMLAWLCVAGGLFQIFKIDELAKGVASMRALPHGVWAALGAFGVVAGLGLVVPGLFKIAPRATPLAAAAVALQSILIAAIYVHYGDSAPLPYVIVMALLAAFIAYGRFALAPH